MGVYIHVRVCVGVVLSLTHIQFVAALLLSLPLLVLIFRRAFICRVVFVALPPRRRATWLKFSVFVVFH